MVLTCIGFVQTCCDTIISVMDLVHEEPTMNIILLNIKKKLSLFQWIQLSRLLQFDS